MNKNRKESNCKSVRLTPRIIELYNTTNLTTSEIARVLKVTTPTIKKVAIENGISKKRYTKRHASILLKAERNEKIIADLRSGKTFVQLAKEHGVSKARINELAKKNGISRWEMSREKYTTMVSQIEADYNAGMGYDEIVEKYKLDNRLRSRLRHYGLDSLFSKFKNIRDLEITRQYRRMPASAVVRNPNPLLDDPNRIETEGGIYKISTSRGFRKYPNIERGVKGIFVDKKVIDIIKARKNSKYKYTNQMIADELNEKGLRTAYGRKFQWHTVQNIWGKYKRQGARKTKVNMSKFKKSK